MSVLYSRSKHLCGAYETHVKCRKTIVRLMKLCFQRLFTDIVFDLNAYVAVNYGGIGVLIGHEMKHSFDVQVSKLDANGI